MTLYIQEVFDVEIDVHVYIIINSMRGRSVNVLVSGPHLAFGYREFMYNCTEAQRLQITCTCRKCLM